MDAQGASTSKKKKKTVAEQDPCTRTPPVYPEGKASNKRKEIAGLSPTKKKLNFAKKKTVRVLLPNRTSVEIILDVGRVTSVSEFVELVQEATEKRIVGDSTRPVKWGPNVWIENILGHKVHDVGNFGVTIVLQDGEPCTEYYYPSMWNVTPRPEMLGRLPQGYSLETALADQVDNALQAIWQSDVKRKVISVSLEPDKITIFDSGQGMDASPENSIANWGTVGMSTHRGVHHLAVGGDPPYLKPYLGKYGAGGVAAALHLGQCATVYSKTKRSKKVVSLVVEQRMLIERHKENPQGRIWRTAGTLRDVTAEERKMAPGGSFTRVEISKLKAQYCFEASQQYWKVEHVRQMLKDIYFPYIQSDAGTSAKTVCPVEFEVNGINLAEVLNSEAGIANMHTCTGEPFIIDLQMQIDDQRKIDERSPSEVANARMSIQYFPNRKGKEQLQNVVDKMTKIRPGYAFTFESMPRIGIRWLGRLLPETQWPILPFMEVPIKREKRYARPQWGKRVKAFVETDAGFQPTQSKTELERDHPFTVALRHLGSENVQNTSGSGVKLIVKRGGQQLPLKDLSMEYWGWLKNMHENYDEEVSFIDVPTYVFGDANLDKLGASKQVLVFHRQMKDINGEWVLPVRVRLSKGLVQKRSDLYATVEYFFYDGTEDDHGEVKFLCRALEVQEAEGCKITCVADQMFFELNKSTWFPVMLLNDSKCQRLDESAWKRREEEVSNRLPSHIEILNEETSRKLECLQVLPANRSTLKAGSSLPAEFLVVVRPRKGSGALSRQGMIIAEAMEMILSVSHCTCMGGCKGKSPTLNIDNVHSKFFYSCFPRQISSSGVKGLYCFNMTTAPKLVKQGTYTFKFEIVGDKTVKPALSMIYIIPSDRTCKWTICTHADDCKAVHPEKPSNLLLRLGKQLQEGLYLGKIDEFGNQQNFDNPINLEVTIWDPKLLSVIIKTTIPHQQVELKSNRTRLLLKNLGITGASLQKLEPSYEAFLHVGRTGDEYAEMPIKVYPGDIESVEVKGSQPSISGSEMSFESPLQPHGTIHELTLQGKDTSGNHIDESQKIGLILMGMEFIDRLPALRQVNKSGCLKLGGLLKVTTGYNSAGSISVVSERSVTPLMTIGFRTKLRKLVASKFPEKCVVGSCLEGILVQIVDEFGTIDTAMHGAHHSLTMDWMKNVTCPLTNGECVLPPVSLPPTPGFWKGIIALSEDDTLKLELHVELEMDQACTLGALKEIDYTSHFPAVCGELFMLPFGAFDGHGHPALLSKEMIDSIVVIFENDMDIAVSKLKIKLLSIERAETPNVSGYHANIIVCGMVGSYKVLVKDASSQIEGFIEASLTITSGDVALLKPMRSVGEHLSEFRQEGISILNELEVARCSEFPSVVVLLQDAEGNVCDSFEGQHVMMSSHNSEHWADHTAVISKGCGRFEPFYLDIPTGSYIVSVTFARVKQKIFLKVTHGNYPVALKVLNQTELQVSLKSNKVIPETEIIVQAADNQPLRKKHMIGLRISGHDRVCFGEPKVVPESFGESMCSVYSFRNAVVPTKVGRYSLEYFVDGHDNIPPVSRNLCVSHGLPSKIEFVRDECHQGYEKVMVTLLDEYGNLCIQDSGMKLLMQSKSFSTSMPHDLARRTSAVLENGWADFGNLRLLSGSQGLYKVKVFPDGAESGVIAAEARILITSGGLSKTFTERCQQLDHLSKETRKIATICRDAHHHLSEHVGESEVLEKKVKEIKEELRQLEEKRRSVASLAIQEGDEAQLSGVWSLPPREVEAVVNDLRNLARQGNGAALAFWEARLRGNFLSPESGNPLAHDIVGLAVMLGRVECESLNRILSEFIGQNSLLLMVCKTQAGVGALELHDERGRIIESRGLHGFAAQQGYRLNGRYDVLTLMDIRKKLPAVDVNHPQRLLQLPPPRLPNGNIPQGFIGYAVNLINISEEHLKVNIVVQRRTVGLRESLFYHILGALQVYDSRQHMLQAKDSHQIQNGAISLDGGMLRANLRQSLGSHGGNLKISFPRVSFNERLAVNLMQVGAVTRYAEIKKLDERIIEFEQHHTRKVAALQEVQGLVAKYQENLERVKYSVADIQRKTDMVSEEVRELSEAMKVIDRRRNMSSQNNSEESMKAYLL